MSKVLKFTDGQQTSSDGNSSWPFGSGEQKVSSVIKLEILSDEWEINTENDNYDAFLIT